MLLELMQHLQKNHILLAHSTFVAFCGFNQNYLGVILVPGQEMDLLLVVEVDPELVTVIPHLLHQVESEQQHPCNDTYLTRRGTQGGGDLTPNQGISTSPYNSRRLY